MQTELILRDYRRWADTRAAFHALQPRQVLHHHSAFQGNSPLFGMYTVKHRLFIPSL
jgi:hypothetical protein